jgi:hypothetical protein
MCRGIPHRPFVPSTSGRPRTRRSSPAAHERSQRPIRIGVDRPAARLGDRRLRARPTLATPDVFDPLTCQHALRQARRLAKTLRGKAPKPYRYKSLGQGATLGKDKGIANAFGMRMRSARGGAITRAYHLHQIPLFSRRIRVLTDGTLSAFFRRDMTEMGLSEPLRRGSRP